VIASGSLALAVFPLGAAVVATLFAWRLGARFARRRRAFEGHWTVALAMFAVASAAMFLGVAGGWTAAEFRLYWLFGAVLNVPYLFLGELQLLIRRRIVSVVGSLAIYALTAVAVVVIWRAPIHAEALTDRLPLGKDVFGAGTAPHRLAQYYAFPAYFLLLAGLVWSASQMRGDPELRDRTVGTLGIAVGATLVAIGSGVGAAFHVVPLFSVSLAAGVVAMFAGFLRAGRPTRAPA